MIDMLTDGFSLWAKLALAKAVFAGAIILGAIVLVILFHVAVAIDNAIQKARRK